MPIRESPRRRGRVRKWGSTPAAYLLRLLAMEDQAFAAWAGVSVRTAQEWRLGNKQPRTPRLLALAERAGQWLNREITIHELQTGHEKNFTN